MSELHVYENLEQRSPEWYAARCGLVTASMMGTLVIVGPPDALAVECPTCEAEVDAPCLAVGRKVPTPIKTIHDPRSAKASGLPPVIAPANNDSSRGLLLALAAERITGHVEETFTSADMERGILAEPHARDTYAEHVAKEPVNEVGFMVRDFGGFSIGYSPDGLVGNDGGLLEVKSPRQKGHLATVIGGEVPAAHMAQLQTGLLVKGCEWIDFASYCGGMHLWTKRVTADERWRSAILAAAEQAERAINDLVTTYKQAVDGLPLTKRIDYDQLGLVF